MTEWKLARKKPVVIQYREVFEDEKIKTREGELWAVAGNDYVIKGVEGEIYPISKTIFRKTYELISGADFRKVLKQGKT